jgi:hypothetical protein
MTPRVGPANIAVPIKYGLYTDIYEHCKCINVLHTHITSIAVQRNIGPVELPPVDRSALCCLRLA